MKKIIIGVMGPGKANTRELDHAYQLGKLIAAAGWVLLTGGRNVGIMEAVNQGAKSAGGLTVGILPHHDTQGASKAVDIAIVTDLGNARNNINVLSSDVVIACGMGLGTASEIALALKNGKKVILLTDHQESHAFFKTLSQDNVFVANEPQEAIALVSRILQENLKA